MILNSYSNPKKRNVALNIAHTKYAVIRYVGRRLLNWTLTRNDHPETWEVLWADTTVPAHILAAMKPYQRVNHFPGMYAIARKSNLCMNLNRMRRAHAKHYNFYPKTWFLPAELSEAQRYMAKHRQSTFIVKPEASSQGKGIYLVRDLGEISNAEHCIVQTYVSDPLLIDGLKFDMRIYVLVTGCSPLRVYIYNEGLARFATESYRKPSAVNKKDLYMHLTNYAVNRKNPKFVKNLTEEEDNVGHKRSLTALFAMLKDRGFNVDGLWEEICDIVAKTLATVQASLAHTYASSQPHDITNAMCFEILGFDILVDSCSKPWLLEVNHSPSLTTGSPLDKKIKRELIRDTFYMLDLSPSDRTLYESKMKRDIQERTLHNKPFELKQREREISRQQVRRERDLNEKTLCDRFSQILPGENDAYYTQFMDTARGFWEEFTGSRSKKNSTQEIARVSSAQSCPVKPATEPLSRTKYYFTKNSSK